VKGGYTPDTIVVRAGEPVRLQFYRDETADCSERVVFEDFGIDAALPAFQTTPVEFTPEEAGEFRFRCGMNMLKGVLVVEPATADALERAVERAGFRVAAPIAAEDPLERERLAREREVRALTWKFALAAVVTVVSVLGSMLLMAHDADAMLKQIDLLGRLLMPLALRLQEALAGRGALDPQWIKVGLAVLTL